MVGYTFPIVKQEKRNRTFQLDCLRHGWHIVSYVKVAFVYIVRLSFHR